MDTLKKNVTYTIDSKHTNVEFVVRHLMISKVRGRFAGVSGTIEVPAGSDVPSKIDVTVDVASIDTREEQRDGHLRSPDFFEVEKYPNITFASSRIEGEPSSFRIHGTLTIHGTSREVVLEAEFGGRGDDPWGNHRVGYEAHATISRKDFGMTWNQALELGGVAVGDEVKIEIAVEAYAPKG